MAGPRTLYDKIWDDHLAHEADDGTCLLYIDRHLVHEVTSPQAFEGLRMTGRSVRAPEKTLAVVDHNVPTTDRSKGIAEEESRIQVETLAKNAAEFGVQYFSETDARQGIVHIIGPEQGFTLPGTTIVCGDSHTSTHGAFGALAHGIGTSEVEHVLATQTLIQKKALNMKVQVDGKLARGATAKDIILAVIGEIGTAGGTGHVIEFAGEAIRDLSMEGRMTVCNMTIEGGARAGMIAPDEKAYEYLKGRPMSPSGANWDAAMAYWETLFSDDGAHFDEIITLDAASLPPIVSCRGAHHRRMSSPWQEPCRTLLTLQTKQSGSPNNVRWTIWAWRPAPGLPILALMLCGSGRAPMAVSRTCAKPPALSKARRSPSGWITP